MKIKWTEGASKNLHQIEEFIAKDNPKAAIDVILKIIKSVELLKNNPSMGKIGRIFDTRELIIAGSPFIVPYRIKHEQIEVLRVLHSSMQWPNFL
ncbi:MAG: toxin ParE1/3/4 [Pseudomonadota bacterium]|nr:toxin ParE1/3/4 [Pseudomonadota bacterium]